MANKESQKKTGSQSGQRGSDKKQSGTRGGKQFTGKGDRKQGRQKDTDGAPFKDQDSLPTPRERAAAEMDNDGAKLSRSNPVNLYTKFDRFVTDAATLPFANPLGAINTHEITVGSAHAAENDTVPGVMAIEFTPSIGVSRDFTSPVNRSSIRFYTYLRSNQKASASYDHQDVTMMEVSLDSCFMFHGLMSKIYAILNQFTPMNEYYSRATVAACYADFDDLRANVQDFRAYINAYAYSLGQYALPAGITLFDRHRWMVEGLYTDSTSTRAQTYMFVPDGFWKYDNTVSTGSQATYVKYSGTVHTFAQLKAFGDALLNAISNEEDFAVISGDIYNFYGGDTYKLPYIDENYAVLPVYDETVLSQIENLTVVPISDSSLVISQKPDVNGGAIIFAPYGTSTLIPANLRLGMNFHHDSPTPEEVIEASRLMCTAKFNSGDGFLEVQTCGTEIVRTLRIYSRSVASGSIEVSAVTSTSVGLVGVNQDTAGEMANNITRISQFVQFDWAPRLEYWLRGGSAPNFTYEYLGQTWDVDNYNFIPEQYLSNIHLGCLLSLFKVGNNREE